MMDLGAIFKAYDIRGLCPGQLDADIARRIGAAFAAHVAATDDATRIVVGRDMRPTGTELVASFTDGVLDQGLDVVDIGLVSTDLLYFASGHLDAPGAMFTASHNPAEYNGLKLCGARAAPVGADTGLASIRRDAESGLAPAGPPGTRHHQQLLDEFVTHVHSFIDVEALRPLKVVADTANGMGGLVVPAVFADLPIEIHLLYPELDGTFPNHPADPIQPENLVDLQRRVTEIGADVGLAFDGDADRVFLIDERAQLVSGSLTTALVAQGILARQPGQTVLHNLICSKVVPEVIEECGGTPVRTRVGHSFIKSVMAETGAVFGGEHSGHYYFRDNWRADSGIIAALVVLERMSASASTLSNLLAPLRRYVASGEINTQVDDPAATIETIAATVATRWPNASVDWLDGLTVDAGQWWFNLRPSNTEPLLRLNLEAGDEAMCETRVAEVRALIEGPA
jgi:phosphomannomutase